MNPDDGTQLSYIAEVVEDAAIVVFSSADEDAKRDKVFEKVWVVAEMRTMAHDVTIDQFPVSVIDLVAGIAMESLERLGWTDMSPADVKKACWDSYKLRACVSGERSIQDLNEFQEQAAEAAREARDMSIESSVGKRTKLENMMKEIAQAQQIQQQEELKKYGYPKHPNLDDQWVREQMERMNRPNQGMWTQQTTEYKSYGCIGDDSNSDAPF